MDYIIEIHIKAWDPDDTRNKDAACGNYSRLHPYHTDEEGNAWFRRQASIIKVCCLSVCLYGNYSRLSVCLYVFLTSHIVIAFFRLLI